MANCQCHDFPPGLIGDIAHWVLASSSYPNADIALATSIGLLSAITGRAYNTYTGAGLNQYILLLAETGMGKEIIANAIGRLITEITKTVPSASGYKGPSYVASAQGLIKWLDRFPSIICVFGEFGQKLKAMARNPSPNDTALLAGYLDFYSKSGRGAIVDPMAYSDQAKNTAPIQSPALTIIGETVPTVFYEALDESMIANGLLPRFLITEVTGNRPYLNQTPTPNPPGDLVTRLADLTGQCLSLAHSGNVHVVPATREAAEKFAEFERWTTDQINDSRSEVHRQLWNRANLKALKLASVYAVGVNFLNPSVDVEATMWATNLIVKQTAHLLGKFERNDVGPVEGNEVRQQAELRRVIYEYILATPGKYEKCGCSFDMHRDHIFTQGYLSRRLINLPTFANDKRVGATNALKRAIRELIENDEIRRVSTGDLLRLYRTAAISFGIKNECQFVKSLEKKDMSADKSAKLLETHGKSHKSEKNGEGVEPVSKKPAVFFA